MYTVLHCLDCGTYNIFPSWCADGHSCSKCGTGRTVPVGEGVVGSRLMKQSKKPEHNDRFKVAIVSTRKAMLRHEDIKEIVRNAVKQWEDGLIIADSIISGIVLYDTEKSEFVNLQF